jgi:hypothetical protein
MSDELQQQVEAGNVLAMQQVAKEATVVYTQLAQWIARVRRDDPKTSEVEAALGFMVYKLGHMTCRINRLMKLADRLDRRLEKLDGEPTLREVEGL